MAQQQQQPHSSRSLQHVPQQQHLHRQRHRHRQQQHSQQQHQQQQHLQLQPHHNNDEHDDDDVELITGEGEETISWPYRKVYEMVEYVAATRMGQFFMTRCDSVLKTIEMTAKWSVPQAKLNDKLQRPLPWLPFLMLIITLRLARVWLSIAALMIGNSPISAHDVVYFMQTRRRKLRALRLQGIKELNEKSSQMPGYQQSSLKSQLMNILNLAICRPGHYRQQKNALNEPVEIFVPANILQSAVNPTADAQAPKRLRTDDNANDDDDRDANLTIDQMLDKYAAENADDDPDYIPDQAALDTSAASVASVEMVEEDAAETNEHASDVNNSQNSENISFNQSVEMLQIGENSETLPKPMIEVKKEVHSGSSPERAASTAPTNASKSSAKQNEMKKEAEKSHQHHTKTAGHSKAHEKKHATMNLTAAAGSSPDFSAFQHQLQQSDIEMMEMPLTINQAHNSSQKFENQPQVYASESTDDLKRIEIQQKRGNGHQRGHGNGHHHGHGNNAHHQHQRFKERSRRQQLDQQ